MRHAVRRLAGTERPFAPARRASPSSTCAPSTSQLRRAGQGRLQRGCGRRGRVEGGDEGGGDEGEGAEGEGREGGQRRLQAVVERMPYRKNDEPAESESEHGGEDVSERGRGKGSQSRRTRRVADRVGATICASGASRTREEAVKE